MHCDLCGTIESMPFKCRYCKEIFCSVHRLPPNHNCFFLQDYLEQPEKDREFLERIEGRAGSPQVRFRSSLYNMIYLRFSKVEILHLVIATALVAAVGMSLYRFQFRWDFLAIFISAFIIHELRTQVSCAVLQGLGRISCIVLRRGDHGYFCSPILSV